MASAQEIEKARLEAWRADNPFADRALGLLDDESTVHSADAQVVALAIMSLAFELHVRPIAPDATRRERVVVRAGDF